MKTTKELVLERIAQQIDEQTAKGATKYNKPLEACGLTDYDWQALCSYVSNNSVRQA